ncbi:fimbrial protein, partial [Escherichia coli]|nr:fimbrial protein [Escherichia coli]
VMSQKFVVGAGLLVCSVCSLSAMAGSKPVDLILRVLVDAPPPCSIKGSQVVFGNMIADNVDGTNYRQDAKYTWNCTNSLANDLRMQLKGNTSTINGETVLSTNITGLGIRIENSADNSLFAVGENSWTPFNINNQPQLKA